jgi:hypothetical protein
MPDSSYTRDDRWHAYVVEANAISHELVERSRKLLSGTAPNLFLGRRTQEPFPTEAGLNPPK